jgi:hypothetical protein
MSKINTDGLYDYKGKKVSLVIKKGEKEVKKKGTITGIHRKHGETLAIYLDDIWIGISKIVKFQNKKFIRKEKHTGNNKLKEPNKIVKKKISKKKVDKKKISKKKVGKKKVKVKKSKK